VPRLFAREPRLFVRAFPADLEGDPHARHPPVPTTRDNLLAFRISGKVEKEDMHEMAEMANAAFDRFETVDMLLIFDNFAGRDTGALFDGRR
jgi:hypothetical protein